MSSVIPISRSSWPEAERSAALDSYGILDSPREADFDDIALIASQVCGTPIAVVNLVDTHRQFFMSEVGLGVRETPIDSAFCTHAILAEDLIVVPDALKDPRFDCNPLVIGEPGLRFYAGAVMKTPEGMPIGTVCVLDYVPRELTSDQIRTLSLLAKRAQTQLELRRALGRSRALETRHRQIVDSAVDFAIVCSDLSGTTTSWSVGAENVLGWSEAAILGKPIDVIFTPEDRSMGVPDRERKGAREDGRAIDERWHMREDGSRFWGSGEMMPLRDSAERHVGYLKIMRDRTEERAAEQQRLELTMELSHRMKNSLAVVQAIVAQTFRTARTLEEGRDAIAGRLQALSSAQDILTQTTRHEADIREVVISALLPHQSGDDRIAIIGGPALLNSDQVLGLSLALHELATNALKYGALSVTEGKVAISWDRRPGGEFRFRWQETDGPSVSQPERKGFGTRLMERMVASYFSGVAKLTYAPAGLIFDLEGVVAMEPAVAPGLPPAAE